MKILNNKNKYSLTSKKKVEVWRTKIEKKNKKDLDEDEDEK
jgi:hypothetical protein